MLTTLDFIVGCVSCQIKACRCGMDFLLHLALVETLPIVQRLVGKVCPRYIQVLGDLSVSVAIPSS